MAKADVKTVSDGLKKKNSEQKLRARAVSRGVVVGRVVSLHGKRRQFYKRNLSEDQLAGEVRRFRAAVRLARRHLKNLIQQKFATEGGAQVDIFETHLLILEDRSLLEKIGSAIESQKVNAE